MEYQLVALDLDDTLLDSKQRLSSEIISIINSIQEAGIKVIVATGRMLVSALPYIQKMGLSGPMITYNGAYVKDISTGMLVYHQPVRLDLAKEIIDFAVDNNLHLNLYHDDKLFVAERTEAARYYESTSGIMAREVGPLKQFISQDVTKLVIVELDQERKSHYLKMAKEKFSTQVAITESKPVYIEFMAKGVSKGVALKKVAKEMGIERKRVVAIGDNWNDLEMIKWAGLGVMMAHSSDELKEAADLIAPSTEEGGVSLLLQEIFSNNT
jgi:Cof subfamily protein (haloacid dehalogenase superfamily)